MAILEKAKKVTLELDLENPHDSKIFVDGVQVANVTDVKMDVSVHRKSEVKILAIDINTIGESIFDHIDRSDIQVNPKCPVCGFVR